MTTIPGIQTYHPRESWEPGPGTPLYGDLRRSYAFHRQPPRGSLADVDRDAIHYTAAIDIPDGDPGESTNDVRSLLRNAHWDYLVNRSGGGYSRLEDGRWFPGYPLGYSWAIDWLGGVWEINGFEYRPGATNGHNNHTRAFLMLTDRHDHGTPEMWASLRALRRECQRRGSRAANRPWGHREFFENTGIGTPTACPGAPNLEDIHRGLGDLDYDNIQEPITVQELVFLQPDRLIDTRSTGDRFTSETRTVQVPVPAKGAKITVTAVSPTTLGHATVWPDGPKPQVSCLNFGPGNGSPIANTTDVALNASGTFQLWVKGDVDILVDLIGVWR